MNGAYAILFMDCSKSLPIYPKERILEKVYPLIHYDDDLYRLLESFCNLPILDEKGRDYSNKKGVPPLSNMNRVLFNIYLDDIDQEIEAQLPKNVIFVRFLEKYYLLSKLKDPSEIYKIGETLNRIFISKKLVSPIIRIAFRGGRPFSLYGYNLSINNDGSLNNGLMCKLLKGE